MHYTERKGPRGAGGRRPGGLDCRAARHRKFGPSDLIKINANAINLVPETRRGGRRPGVRGAPPEAGRAGACWGARLLTGRGQHGASWYTKIIQKKYFIRKFRDS